MSKISNIDVQSIETMKTRDAFKLVNRLMEFKREYRVIICNFIEYEDINSPKMVNIEVTVQVFKDAEKQDRYIFKTSRAHDFTCSNAYIGTKLGESNFHSELEFQFRFNELTKKAIV